MGELRDFFNVFLRNKFFYLVVGSTLISGIICAFFLILVGWVRFDGYLPVFKPQDPVTVAVLFPGTLIVIFVSAYFSTRNELEDIVSPIRKALIGNWIAHYQRPIRAGGIDKEIPMQQALSITIDQIEKLAITWKIFRNEFLEDDDIRIKDVSINTRQEPYTLFYYFDSNVRLKGTNNKLHLKIFLEATFAVEKEGRRNIVKQMNGRWYDLDGSVVSLMQIPRDQNEPSAYSGVVDFRRQLDVN